jgi:hypothetical protein
VEAAPGLDRRADDDELRAAVRGDARHVLAEPPRPRAEDLPPNADAVRARHGCRELEPAHQTGELAVHVRVERQLVLDHERRDEDDPRSTVGREPAGEIERVLRLLPLQERHDDVAVAEPHRNSW